MKISVRNSFRIEKKEKSPPKREILGGFQVHEKRAKAYQFQKIL